MKQKIVLITLNEAAELTRLAKKTIYNKIALGQFTRYGNQKKVLLDKREVCLKENIPFDEKESA